MLAGGYMGQYPDLVAKAVLAEPGELTHTAPDQLRTRQSASQGLAYYRVLVPTIFETFHMQPQDADAQADYIFDRMSKAFIGSSEAGYLCADESVDAAVPDVSVPPSRFGATAFNAIFGAEADLSQIEVNAPNYTDEVLFIASECNTFIGEEFQRAQMTIFPQPRLVVIPNAGHNMISENPADSLAVIREYFAS